MEYYIHRSTTFLLCMAVFTFALLSANNLLAQNVDDLIKGAESELRRSKSNLFSGRYEDVYSKLQETDKKIAAAQKADPAHSQLKKVIDEFMSQKKKVEEKLGKELPITFDPDLKQQEQATELKNKTAEVQTSGASATPVAASAGAVEKKSDATILPYDARYPMQQFKNASNSFNNNYKDFTSAGADMQASYMKRMADNLKVMKSNLQSAKEKAATKGVTSHPDFDEAQRQIDEAETKYASLKTGYEKKLAENKVAGQKIAGDSEGIKEIYNQLNNGIFSKATGVAAYYNKVSEVEPLLENIEKFEKNDKTQVEQTLAEFAAKYGDTEDAIEKSTGDWQTANSYVEIKNGIVNVAKTREAMTVDLLKKYEKSMSNLSSIAEIVLVDYVSTLKEYLDMALRFSPDHPQAKKALNEHQGRIDAELSSFYAKIDKREWPGHSSNAPSDKDDLADAALEWFKNDPGWGKRDKNPEATDKQARKPIAVAVKGPWSVQKKNLLGNPIMYGIPVLIAVEVANEKSLNLVRVYDVTMRTAEKTGIKQEPPFVSLTVGSSWYIRPSAL